MCWSLLTLGIARSVGSDYTVRRAEAGSWWEHHTRPILQKHTEEARRAGRRLFSWNRRKAWDEFRHSPTRSRRQHGRSRRRSEESTSLKNN